MIKIGFKNSGIEPAITIFVSNNSLYLMTNEKWRFIEARIPGNTGDKLFCGKKFAPAPQFYDVNDNVFKGILI